MDLLETKLGNRTSTKPWKPRWDPEKSMRLHGWKKSIVDNQNMDKGNREKLEQTPLEDIKEKAATKIQSRLRGNITRRKENNFLDSLISVPYRNTSWKSTDDIIPWKIEKDILKQIINAENMDDIIEELDDLEKEQYKTIQELQKLKANPPEQTTEKTEQMINQLIGYEWWLGKKMQDLEKLLKDIKQLNIFQCNSIKNFILADPKLGMDSEIKELIKPCREHKINIYINAFYELPLELFHPIQNSPSIYSKIESFPDEIFTNYGKSMLRKTLEDFGLMYNDILGKESDGNRIYGETSHREFTPRYSSIRNGELIEDPNPRVPITGKMTSFELLANFYRLSKMDKGIDLKHLKNGNYDIRPSRPRNYPYLVPKRADGRIILEQTLEMFEVNIKSRETIQKYPEIGDQYFMIDFPEEYDLGEKVIENYLDKQIHLMKIYFIYALMGIDDIYSYQQFIIKKIDEIKKNLPINVDELKLWEKWDKLENLKLEDFDKYMEDTKIIDNYEFILNNLPISFFKFMKNRNIKVSEPV